MGNTMPRLNSQTTQTSSTDPKTAPEVKSQASANTASEPTRRSAAGKSVKIVDVSHPDATPPPPTSRPIIITNRPSVQADPMVSPTSAPPDSKSTAKPASISVHREKVVSPISVGEADGTNSTTTNSKRSSGPKIDNLESTSTSQSTSEVSNPAQESMPQNQQKPDVGGSLPDVVGVAMSAKEPTPEEMAKIEAMSDSKAPKDVDPTQTQAIESNNDTSDVAVAQKEAKSTVSPGAETAGAASEDSAGLSSASLADPSALPESSIKTPANLVGSQITETGGLEADERQSELERLVEKGIYALPIDAKRSHRVHILLVIICLVMVCLLTINILLDMGIIHLKSVPHTNFF